MGIQRIVLEHHGDIPVLGRNVVHQLAVDIQLAAGDLLQTRYHAQGGGFTAAGWSYQHDKLVILDVEIKVMNGKDAFFSHQQVVLFLLFRFAFLLFLLFGYRRVHFFDVFQYDFSHYYRF